MKKTIVISSVAMFAMFALVGCGGTDEAAQAEQAAKEAQVKSELEAQQQEIDATQDALEQGKAELEGTVDELAEQNCKQELELANTQLALLEAYATSLEDLQTKVDKNPEGAIEICRNLNPGLSKPECDARVEDYMGGKTAEYDETQVKITEGKAQVAELEAKCATEEETMVDVNSNTVTPM